MFILSIRFWVTFTTLIKIVIQGKYIFFFVLYINSEFSESTQPCSGNEAVRVRTIEQSYTYVKTEIKMLHDDH